MEDAGLSFIDVPVDDSIKIAMLKAVHHFKSNGLQTAPVSVLYVYSQFRSYNNDYTLVAANQKPSRDNGNWTCETFRRI